MRAVGPERGAPCALHPVRCGVQDGAPSPDGSAVRAELRERGQVPAQAVLCVH